MEFNDYQQLAGKSLAGSEQVLTQCAIGLASETGEVLEHIQKYTFNHEPLIKAELMKEMGDVLWYLSQIAEWADIPFEEVAMTNIKMLQERYPERFQK